MIDYLKYLRHASCLFLILATINACGKVGGKSPSYFFDDEEICGLCKAVSSGNLKQINRFIKSGVDVNARGRDNMTPLLWALGAQEKESFCILLENGADPNIRINADQGTSVMQLSARANEDYFLRTAVKHGGDVNFTDEIGRSPIFHVISKLDLDRVKLLVELGADVNHRDKSGGLPVVAAATLNQYNIVYYLLESGANPELPTSRRGASLVTASIPLSYRTINKSHEMFKWYCKTVGLLEEKGYAINLKAFREKYNYEALPSEPDLLTSDFLQKNR